MKLQSNKRNHSIYLPILGCQNKCLKVRPSLALCAFRLCYWNLFVLILRVFFQLDNTKHNLILILALKPILGKILLGISTPKLDIQDFVYISVICKATSVRSSVGLKYQLECDKVQQLQTHCGHALFFGGKSLYKDILFLCPQWGSGPSISRNFLI